MILVWFGFEVPAKRVPQEWQELQIHHTSLGTLVVANREMMREIGAGDDCGVHGPDIFWTRNDVAMKGGHP
jgi:hypothetical protein